uniref:ADF-H domain-containing protein n=1 Tax=Buteo japonicus TaxID=224669 RepID=A0A8B9Z9I0_9AVES
MGRWRGHPTLPLAMAHPRCLPRALYTYEDGSDDLKLAASGGGGLLELSGHFEIQKVMYGFCSVKDPQAVLPKHVLVNWVSGGATPRSPWPWLTHAVSPGPSTRTRMALMT